MMLYIQDGPEEYQCAECLKWYPRDMVGMNDEGRIVCEFCIDRYPEELAKEYHYFYLSNQDQEE